MERNILIDDIDTLSYRLQSHENSEDGYPYALGIYVNNGTPLEVYNTLHRNTHQSVLNLMKLNSG